MLTRRREHADALNEHGLHVSGKTEYQAAVTATDDPDALQPFDVAIVATKAAGLESAVRQLEGRFPDATVVTVLNGIGAEQVVRSHGDWSIVSGVTFMSGTRHSDTHVEYILDTETWLGPYEDTPFAVVQDIADTDRRLGPEGRGAPGSASRAVVEADLQRIGQRDRRADGASARLPLRAGGGAGRARAPRPRARRRGEGRGGRCRDRAPRRPVGDERPRDATWLRALPVDARGCRRTPSDRDRAHHGLARSRSGETNRSRAIARIALRARQRQGSIVAGITDRRADMKKVWRATLALAGRGGRGGRRRRRRNGRVGAGDDRDDRLGVRRRRRDGAVRRAGSRGREDAHRPGQQGERDQAPADHLQHAEQQARDREGMCFEAAEPGRRHHHDHLRRRLRGTRRAIVDQRGQAHGGGVHRHRPDGPEALRRQGTPCVLLRQRRAGRGLGDGGVRVEAWLEDGIARDRYGHRLLPQRRAGVRGALHTTRREDRRRRRRTSRSAATRRRGRAR